MLLVDLAEEAEPDAALGDLVKRCGPQTRVIAIGTVNDVTLFRRLAARGVADYLVKPVSSELLCDALRRASRSEGEGDSKRRARIHAFIGARGGVGASTLALGLAWLLSQEHKLPTALIDLDLHFGNLALSLDLEPGRGLRQALEHPERTDSLLLASAMVKGEERLPILAAEESLEDMLRFEPEGARALLEALAQDYDCLVVDLPRSLDAAARHVLQSADASIIVTDLSLAALRDAFRLAGLVKALDGPTPMIVANQVGALHRGEIGRAEFERGLGTPLDFLVPFDAKAARAMAVGGKALPAADREQGRGRDAPPRRAHRRRGSADQGRMAPLAQVTRHVRAKDSENGLNARVSALIFAAASASGRPSLSWSKTPCRCARRRRPRRRRRRTTTRKSRPPKSRTNAGRADAGRGGRAGAGTAADPAPSALRGRAAAACPRHQRNTITSRATIEAAIPRIYPLIMERIDTEVAAKLSRDELARQLGAVVGEILIEQKIQLNQAEQRHLVTVLLDDMLGLGPLEPLLGRRRRHRHHGQRAQAGLCRAQRQARADRRRLPRQQPCHEHRHAHRHAGRPPHRRIDAAGRRAPRRTAAASTSSSRRSRSTAPRSRSANSPRRAITLDMMARQGNISPAMATVLKIAGALAAQHPDLRRHRLGQDDACSTPCRR